MWDQGETSSQEQPWGKVQFPHQGIHITISLRSSADVKYLMNILHSREKVIAGWPQEPQMLIWEATWVQIRGMQALHALWSFLATAPLNNCYKLQIPPCWNTVLRAVACCVPLCLTKQWRYSFLLHLKLCLWDLIFIGAQRMNFGITTESFFQSSSCL